MLVSEAIRLGAMLRPQCFVVMFAWDLRAKTFKSCALGALAEASGEMPNVLANTVDYVECGLAEKFPALMSKVPFPPCCGCFAAHLAQMYSVIAHLNDEHQWTRERIADWVATVEIAEPVTASHSEELVLALV